MIIIGIRNQRHNLKSLNDQLMFKRTIRVFKRNTGKLFLAQSHLRKNVFAREQITQNMCNFLTFRCFCVSFLKVSNHK